MSRHRRLRGRQGTVARDAATQLCSGVFCGKNEQHSRSHHHTLSIFKEAPVSSTHRVRPVGVPTPRSLRRCRAACRCHRARRDLVSVGTGGSAEGRRSFVTSREKGTSSAILQRDTKQHSSAKPTKSHWRRRSEASEELRFSLSFFQTTRALC